MIKVTYKLANLFSLRKFKDSHLCARSYEYPMLTTIRGALLGSLIQRRGVSFAKNHFEEIANVDIFVQVPKIFEKNEAKLRLFSNNSYSKTNVTEDFDSLFTMGIREYVYMDNITFYIDDSLEYIVELLVNIDRIGSSDSMVYLESIEKVDFMENILIEWNEELGYNKKLYDLYDWKTTQVVQVQKEVKNKKGEITLKNSKKIIKGTNFEERYLYSKKQKDNNKKLICIIEEKVSI